MPKLGMAEPDELEPVELGAPVGKKLLGRTRGKGFSLELLAPIGMAFPLDTLLFA